MGTEARARFNAKRRADRLANPEKYRAARRSDYQKYKDREKEQHLRWSRIPEVAERRRRRRKELLEANPDRRDAKIAKDVLSRSLGVSQKALPPDLVALKVIDMRLRRLLKENGVALQANY